MISPINIRKINIGLNGKQTKNKQLEKLKWAYY